MNLIPQEELLGKTVLLNARTPTGQGVMAGGQVLAVTFGLGPDGRATNARQSIMVKPPNMGANWHILTIDNGANDWEVIQISETPTDVEDN